MIVIGAGPAGNNAALRLASMGYRVTVIDRRSEAEVGDKLCSGIVGAACARQYPLDESLVYRPAQSATLFSPAGHPFHFAHEQAQAYIINRVGYVASIGHRAQRAGATYLFGHTVTEIEPSSERVTVRTVNNSTAYQLKAKVVVVASGFGPALTRPLGLGTIGDYVTGIQAEVKAPGLGEVQVYCGSQHAPGFFAWLVPTFDGRALAGLLCRRQGPAHIQRLLAGLRAAGTIEEMIKEPRQWGVPLRPLAKTYGLRVLVVGDAAGQVKPITGGGIFYSMVASDLAAETLNLALERDDFSEATLSVYQHRWKKMLLRELEVGYNARRIFEQLKDSQIDFLMRVAGRSGIIQNLVNLHTTDFDWHSGVVTKLLRHPAVGGILSLIRPLWAGRSQEPLSEPPGDPQDPPMPGLAFP